MTSHAHATTTDACVDLADHAAGLEQEIIELVRSAKRRPRLARMLSERVSTQLDALYDELAQTAEMVCINASQGRAASR